MIVTTKFYKQDILDLNQYEEVLDIRVLVKKSISKDNGREIIFIGMEFDTRVYKSQSWAIRPVRILLVLTSKAC